MNMRSEHPELMSEWIGLTSYLSDLYICTIVGVTSALLVQTRDSFYVSTHRSSMPQIDLMPIPVTCY